MGASAGLLPLGATEEVMSRTITLEDADLELVCKALAELGWRAHDHADGAAQDKRGRFYHPGAFAHFLDMAHNVERVLEILDPPTRARREGR
jgi:hypothetical protein